MNLNNQQRTALQAACSLMIATAQLQLLVARKKKLFDIDTAQMGADTAAKVCGALAAAFDIDVSEVIEAHESIVDTAEHMLKKAKEDDDEE